MKFINLRCSICGGQKFIGESYVDVTCVACGDSKDIEVEKLEKFLKAINRRRR
jgi:formate dehydrogenase maturation protein FdhE